MWFYEKVDAESQYHVEGEPRSEVRFQMRNVRTSDLQDYGGGKHIEERAAADTTLRATTV
jgi:hypothetical protein